MSFFDKWSPWRLRKRIKQLEQEHIVDRQVLFNLGMKLASYKERTWIKS
jgi:hypothetical protein